MSIKVTKIAQTVGDLSKMIVAKGFKKSPKSPNLVTLSDTNNVNNVCCSHNLVATTNGPTHKCSTIVIYNSTVSLLVNFL